MLDTIDKPLNKGIVVNFIEGQYLFRYFSEVAG